MIEARQSSGLKLSREFFDIAGADILADRKAMASKQG